MDNNSVGSLLAVTALINRTGVGKHMNMDVHRVPQEYIPDFEEVAKQLGGTAKWKSAGPSNTWLELKLPGLELAVWFK